MPRWRDNYVKGTVFGIPLRDEGWARGVVARMDGKGTCLGYFFGPRLPDVATAGSQTGRLAPNQAVLVGMFGDLGLLKGEWPHIGSIEPWRDKMWPVPQFRHYDDVGRQCYVRHYDPQTLAFVRETKVAASECEHYPKDGLMGYGAVEIRLTRLLLQRL